MTIRILLAAITLIGFGAFGAGCNDDGGDSLSLEEYFGRVEELRQAEDDRFNEIQQELESRGQSATPEDTADAFEEVLNAYGESLNGFRDLEPPSAVQDAHDDAVEVLDAVRDDFQGVLGDLRDAESGEATDAIFDGASASFDRADQVCRDLQQIAEDNSIDVDLRCSAE